MSAAVSLVTDVTVPVDEEGEWDLHPPSDLEALPGLLDDIAELFDAYVAFPTPEARDAIALWIVHTWNLDYAESTPRLAVLSPERGSGKTRTLEVAELLVPNPLRTVNVTAAALFRLVDKQRTTLLLDEADTYLSPKHASQHAELQAFVNAGHRRGAEFARCVGDSPKSMDVKMFPAYAAVAIAGIGDLPETVLHRSVIIRQRRRAPHEKVRPFRDREIRPIGEAIRERLSVWSENNGPELERTIPTMPPGIEDRPADVWEPLVAIGDLAGEKWCSRARAACVQLAGAAATQTKSLREQLLADIRQVFDETATDRLFSSTIVDRLIELDEAPWANLKGQAIDTRTLARMLKPYDVHHGTIRIGNDTAKGYKLTDLHDAFLRYLPARVTTVTSDTVGDLRAWCSNDVQEDESSDRTVERERARSRAVEAMD
jgi:hypothetical protein